MTNSQEQKDIALIYQDIKYIKQDMAEIKAALKLVLEHYVTREEIEDKHDRIQTEIDKRMEGVHKRLDTKADKEDLKRIENIVMGNERSGKINWNQIAQSVITTIITGAIIGGLVYFNLK